MSSVTMHWYVPLDHPAFAGHFPGTPILPGVILLDWALQTISEANNILLGSCTINSVKFLSPAQPGDALTLTFSQLESGAFRFDIASVAHKIATGSVVINSKA